MLVHVMLDLETWGTEPGCDIRSIGACTFGHPPGVGRSHFYRATRSPWWMLLLRDRKTVKWWRDQSEEARGAFENPTPTPAALREFSDWLSTVCPTPSNLRLWSHGPAFDPPILARAYKPIAGLAVPWHYRAPRDTRTILEAAGLDPNRAIAAANRGTLHNALDDATAQADAVEAALLAVAAGQLLTREALGLS